MNMEDHPFSKKVIKNILADTYSIGNFMLLG